MQEVKPPFDEHLVTLDEAFGLYLLLLRTKDVIHKAREDELWRGNISSSAEAGVLFLVEDLGQRATPAEISRHLFRRSHGISMLVGRMEKRGLVRKVKDLHRKNLVRVELTEKGQQACKYAAKLESIHRIMSSLSRKEHRQLSSLLQKLCEKASAEAGVDSTLLKRTLPLGY
jgi:DNA-binding MarR family transcriptional regulator